MTEALALAEVAEACSAAGARDVDLTDVGKVLRLTIPAGRVIWGGVLERPDLAFWARDAVRSTIRAIEASGGRFLETLNMGQFCWYREAYEWLYKCRAEDFSTEGAARALVALYRAGLLPVPKLGNKSRDGEDHHEGGTDDHQESLTPVAHAAQDTGGGR